MAENPTQNFASILNPQEFSIVIQHTDPWPVVRDRLLSGTDSDRILIGKLVVNRTDIENAVAPDAEAQPPFITHIYSTIDAAPADSMDLSQFQDIIDTNDQFKASEQPSKDVAQAQLVDASPPGKVQGIDKLRATLNWYTKLMGGGGMGVVRPADATPSKATGGPMGGAIEVQNPPSAALTWNLPQYLMSIRNLATSQPVQVFILDTAPTSARLIPWRTAPVTHALRKLMDVEGSKFFIHYANQTNSLVHLKTPDELRQGLPPSDQDTANQLDNEDVSDHGLFIAQIIHSIAPEAEIHLIEVLNAAGIGTMRNVAEGLEEMKRLRSSTPAVINMSLAFNTPANDVAAWVKELTEDVAAVILGVQAITPALIKRIQDLLGASAEAMDLIIEMRSISQNTNGREVYLAAAGNEYNDPTGMGDGRDGLGPRYPASSDLVEGVGALRRKRPGETRAMPAYYSNRPPDNQVAQRLWAFGGAYGETLPVTDADGGVLGVSAKKPSGYIRWQGTSFSSAVASGVMALAISGRRALSGTGTELTVQQCVQYVINNSPKDIPDSLGRTAPILEVYQS